MKTLTRTFHTSMSDAIGNLLILLSLEWENEDPEQSRAENTGENADEKKKTAGKNHATGEEPPKRPGLACAERCACLYLLTVTLIPLRRIRSLVFGISGLYVFLLLGLTSFHFEPHLTTRTGMIALFLGALGCISYVYSQIYYNKTLSRITDTAGRQPGMGFLGPHGWVRGRAGFEPARGAIPGTQPFPVFLAGARAAVFPLKTP
ncbi:MAG TPA: hypothetical protein VKB48_12810 [Candidatus Acidoferrum sp.]|nr:hypothetical protein [Candidatus Acidoferrum sp.]